MKNMGQQLKKAQTLYKKLGEVQEEIANSIIEVEASGGAVQISITGDQQIQSLKLKPEIVDPSDVDGLEDLILTTLNQAISESKKFADEKTKEVTGDLKLPGGFGF